MEAEQQQLMERVKITDSKLSVEQKRHRKVQAGASVLAVFVARCLLSYELTFMFKVN